MTATARTTGETQPSLRRLVGVAAGLAITAASMSSGFIWASQGQVLTVYVAGFTSWTGYLLAHYAAEDVFVDDVSPAADVESAPAGESESAGSAAGDFDGNDRGAVAELRALLPAEPAKAVGFLVGIVVLVSGIAILAWFVRQENHLLGNLGSGMFLGGYVIAHYFDSGKLL